MISGINLTTGPVAVSPQVMYALRESPISHRSPAFKQLLTKTTGLLSASFQTRKTFLLTGSGTLANEAMLQEIKKIRGKGLILSNGEFGSRLIEQAHRNKMDFIINKIEWGQRFNSHEIKKMLIHHSIKWILFCHCETSTGVINDLYKFTELAKSINCLCFVDCMSTVGTIPLDLSGVAMATASSGKGLASIPGLAIVFSNMELSSNKNSPVYLDLNHYAANGGVPFTISSNLLKALYVSASQKLQTEQFELIQEFGKRFYTILNDRCLVPFNNDDTRVFTLVASGTSNQIFIKNIRKHLLLSHESNYLKSRQWHQLATFGYYTGRQLKYVERSLIDS